MHILIKPLRWTFSVEVVRWEKKFVDIDPSRFKGVIEPLINADQMVINLLRIQQIILATFLHSSVKFFVTKLIFQLYSFRLSVYSLRIFFRSPLGGKRLRILLLLSFISGLNTSRSKLEIHLKFLLVQLIICFLWRPSRFIQSTWWHRIDILKGVQLLHNFSMWIDISIGTTWVSYIFVNHYLIFWHWWAESFCRLIGCSTHSFV